MVKLEQKKFLNNKKKEMINMLNKSTNLIIGGVDSGKTRGIIFNEMEGFINNNENLLIIDEKEEYYPRFKEELENAGYDIHVINLNDASKSDGFNPLSYPYYLYKQGRIDQSLELVNNIATVICKEEDAADPFWSNMAATYLTSLILILFEEAKEEDVNLANIVPLMNSAERESGTLLKDYFDKLDPFNPIYLAGSGTLFAPKETYGSIMATFKGKMNMFLMRPMLLKMLATNNLDLANLKEKTAIFVIAKHDLNVITNMLIEALVKAIKEQKLEFTFILDNFNSLPRLDIMHELIENANYNGIKTVITTYRAEDLKGYKGYSDKHIGNIINMEDLEVIKIDDTLNEVKYPNLKANDIKYIKAEELLK